MLVRSFCGRFFDRSSRGEREERERKREGGRTERERASEQQVKRERE